MSKVDWSKAPEGAEFYAATRYRRNINKGENPYFWSEENQRWSEGSAFEELLECTDFQWLIPAPPPLQQWPEEDRIDIISTNGNTGDHYTKTATDYLSQGMQILTERGKQYGSNGRECSFPQVAEAFNAITGNELSGSDVCMILALLKLVRQSAQPDRLHEDSLVDGVNYMALYAEVLSKELAE